MLGLFKPRAANRLAHPVGEVVDVNALRVRQGSKLSTRAHLNGLEGFLSGLWRHAHLFSRAVQEGRPHATLR